MSAHQGHGEWLPLLDYAARKGVSLSTLRRYIKSNRVDYKQEKGKYFLFDDEPNKTKGKPVPYTSQLDPRMKQLELELQKARQEVAELKMLVALYEEKLPRGLEI